jgi:hypothetical protein
MSELQRVRLEAEWDELMRDVERMAPDPVNSALLTWTALPWWGRLWEWARP